jgi:acyl-CoA synthetase (NDP forming)
VPQWRVYSRVGCCLCEQLIEELAAMLGPAAVHAEVVDISADATLERKYGARIPVLLADGEFVCAYRLDRDRVARLLQVG